MGLFLVVTLFLLSQKPLPPICSLDKGSRWQDHNRDARPPGHIARALSQGHYLWLFSRLRLLVRSVLRDHRHATSNM
ncbi:hypothetical protein B0T18DRAFT_414842 [Schizothecium vesticola]|uniref:Secreted protein n=1 Tax=Schizothecium vesticola TaxID=314040 RepID=A0AA40EPR3_9PEZI|nr:hypothetical protein B0T18DRAFT_414842 [Schizothecium vesticola]